jgi:hypothetical protein
LVLQAGRGSSRAHSLCCCSSAPTASCFAAYYTTKRQLAWMEPPRTGTTTAPCAHQDRFGCAFSSRNSGGPSTPSAAPQLLPAPPPPPLRDPTTEGSLHSIPALALEYASGFHSRSFVRGVVQVIGSPSSAPHPAPAGLARWPAGPGHACMAHQRTQRC